MQVSLGCRTCERRDFSRQTCQSNDKAKRSPKLPMSLKDRRNLETFCKFLQGTLGCLERCLVPAVGAASALPNAPGLRLGAWHCPTLILLANYHLSNKTQRCYLPQSRFPAKLCTGQWLRGKKVAPDLVLLTGREQTGADPGKTRIKTSYFQDAPAQCLHSRMCCDVGSDEATPEHDVPP